MSTADARDSDVPVIRARAELEAVAWRYLRRAAAVDAILAAADRYASAAAADIPGLDAMLGPSRLAAANAEAAERRAA